MRTGFRSLVLAALSAASMVGAVLVGAAPANAIVGGQPVGIDQYPYQVSLQVNRTHHCGGTILNTTTIVTAAHCTAGIAPWKLFVRAGSTYEASGGQLVPVSSIVQHPSYDNRTLDYDVSVLKLGKPLTFDSRTQPTTPAAGFPPAGTPLTVTGWGATSEGGPSSAQLRAVDVQAIANNQCERVFGATTITDRMVCAGVAGGGKDSCQADSGGPLTDAGGALVGIVSWGNGCARAGYPGVYTNVGSVAGFLTEHTARTAPASAPAMPSATAPTGNGLPVQDHY